MDNFQIAHDLAVAKLYSELLGNLDDSHICQKYFKYRTDFPNFSIPMMRITFLTSWIKRK